MPPEPTYLPPTGIELVKHLRDGGSVVIEYSTRGEDRCEVRMPLRKEGKKRADGYHPPVVVDFTQGRTFELTWDQAATLGDQLKPFIHKKIPVGTSEILADAVRIMQARGTMKLGRKGRLVPVDEPPEDPTFDEDLIDG